MKRVTMVCLATILGAALVAVIPGVAQQMSDIKSTAKNTKKAAKNTGAKAKSTGAKAKNTSK